MEKLSFIDWLTVFGILLSFLAFVVACAGVLVAIMAWLIRPEKFTAWWAHSGVPTLRKIGRSLVISIIFLFGCTAGLVARLIVLHYKFQALETSYLVSSNGGEHGPWLDSGVSVKKGDVLRFQASGSVTTAIHHLVEAAQKDELLPTPWVTPDGISPDNIPVGADRPIETMRAHYRIAPKADYLKLLCRISSDDPNKDSADAKKLWLDKDPHCIVVGKGTEAIAPEDGKLWFTVNDVWLDKSMVDIYAPSPADDPQYYSRKLKADGTPQDQAYRRDLWEHKIVAKLRWNVWYQDNSGAFLVNISRRTSRF